LEIKLRTFKASIKANLNNWFIQPSSRPAAVLIPFAKIRDGGLGLYVDYYALKLVTEKIRFPIPLLGEILDRVRKAMILANLDLWGLYNLIHKKDDQEY
jgi:hypothetical protein